MEAIQINHRMLARLVPHHIENNVAAMFWGTPGMGKTEALVQAVVEAGYRPVVVRTADYDAIDAKGYPYHVENADGVAITRFALPSWFPLPGCGKIVVILDDMTQAPSAVQPTWSRLFHEGILGESMLPGFGGENEQGDHCVVMATGNPHTNRAGSYRMPTHTANRMAHYSVGYERVEDHVEQWAAWAVGADVDERVLAFVRFKPESFYRFDSKSVEYAYPTARSWHKVSNVIGEVQSSDSEMLRILTGGIVGQAAGVEFSAFCKALDAMPDPMAILSGDCQDVPSDPGVQYAIVTCLARRTRADNVENAWAYLSGFGEEWQVYWFKDCVAAKANTGFDITQSGVAVEIMTRLGNSILN
jgi:hypothetical protein